MPIDATLSSGLWDVEDAGIDAVLDRAHGELGATGLSIAAVHPPAAQLRLAGDAGPRWFRSDGGLQFQPDAARYRATRAKPLVAEWLRSRNPLRALADACAKRGVALHASIIGCHSPAMARRQPELATKDISGEPSPVRLCPLNADVQAFLVAVVEDLTQAYAVATIEADACGFAGPAGVAEPMRIGGRLDPIASFLLSVCLCESCRRLAEERSVAVSAVERCVRVDLERCLHDGTADGLAADLDEYLARREPLRVYADWRARECAALVARLRDAARPAVLLVHRHPDDAIHGVDALRLASSCDGLIVHADAADGDGVARAVRTATTEIGSPAKTSVAIDVAAPSLDAAPTLVRAVAQVANLGVTGALFENVGFAPPARLGWIAQAIRYARRTD